MMSAVICLALLLRKDSNIVATAVENRPLISDILEPMSNIATIYSISRSLFCSKYRLIPPSRLSAIDAPILAVEPATLPRLNTNRFRNSSAAETTAGSRNMSFRFCPMLLIDCRILSKTSLLPKAMLNPPLNRLASSLALSMSP